MEEMDFKIEKRQTELRDRLSKVLKEIGSIGYFRESLLNLKGRLTEIGYIDCEISIALFLSMELFSIFDPLLFLIIEESVRQKELLCNSLKEKDKIPDGIFHILYLRDPSPLDIEAYIPNLDTLDHLMILDKERSCIHLLGIRDIYKDKEIMNFCHIKIDIHAFKSTYRIFPIEENSFEEIVTLKDISVVLCSLGIIRREMDELVDYLNRKGLWKRQEFSYRLADLYTLYDTSRLLTIKAFWMFKVKDRERELMLRCAKASTLDTLEAMTCWAQRILDGGSILKFQPIISYIQNNGTSYMNLKTEIGGILLDEN